MRLLLTLLLFLPFLLSAQERVVCKMNFQTKAMVAQKGDHEVVSMFIRGDVNQIRSYLKNHSRNIKGQLKNLVYADVTIANIKFLASQHFVEGFEWEWGKKETLSDSLLVKNRVVDVHAGAGLLPQGYTGKGVISGVVDTGIDPTHRDFQNTDSTTRIISIWDQTLPFDAGLTPSYGYGQEFDSALINAGPIAHVDSDRHGTGVASVMAGNGLHTGQYKGVAPESDIVAVELDFSGANLNASADAFKYIYDIADADGKPCVINASYGDYLGSHDGLDATTLFLDSLLAEKPGRLFVSAAGNSGDWGPYHLRHTNSSSTDTSFTWFETQAAGTYSNTVWLDIWGDTSDMNNMQFSVGADHNATFNHGGHLNFRNILSDGMVGTTIVDSIMNGGRLTEVQIYTELRRGQYNMQIFLPGADSADYNYSLITTGVGQIDLWSISYLGLFLGPDLVWLSDIVKTGLPVSGGFPDISNYQLPDSSHSIVTGFQCSPNVATVANYVNRTHYIDWDLATQTNPWQTDSIAVNSSAGPTRTELLKPDIASTGFWVMAALPISNALSFQGGSNSWRLDQDGFHERKVGTSYSSPAVAGIGALLLEKCPNITTTEFLEMLKNTAYTDVYTGALGALPNARWGYGKADAFALLSETNLFPNVTGDTAFCFGEMTTLGTDSAYFVYDWNGVSSASSLNIDSTSNGYLLVEDGRGCKSDSVWYNVVEFDSLITPAIWGNGFDSVWTVTSDSVQWWLNGAPIVGENDTLVDLFVIGDQGHFMVEHFDTNGCSVFTDSLFQLAVSVEEVEVSYTIFPNPTNSKLNVSSSSIIDKIELIDLNGKSVLRRKPKSKEILLDLSNLARGVYFLNLINDKESYNSKIQVLR